MKRMISNLKKEDGFTLIEMSIVIMVVAALLLMIVPNVSGVTKNTNKTTSDAAVQTVEAQIELYKMQNPANTLKEEALLEQLKEDGYITEGQVKAYQSKTPE